METSDQIALLGVSYRPAPVAVREALGFQPDPAAALLKQAAASRPGREALILSTCNRTEFYLVAPPGSNATGDLLSLLREVRPDAPIIHQDCHRYQLSEPAAVQHLFRVASGLDSAIPGDAQILGQVKAAMRVAVQSGSLGVTLQQALTLAVRAGKPARTETRFGWGAASLGAAIGELLAERDAEAPVSEHLLQVLIIGAGEMARDIGRELAKHGGQQITFLNRTLSKAAQLAELCGGRALGWSSLEAALSEADVVT